MRRIRFKRYGRKEIDLVGESSWILAGRLPVGFDQGQTVRTCSENNGGSSGCKYVKVNLGHFHGVSVLDLGQKDD